MGQREDHVVMVTGQQPRPLEGQPALGLEVGALGTRPVATGIVPDARDVAVRAGLDMAAQHRRPALHDGPCSAPDMGGQGMALFVGRKGILEDRLQRDERHRCLRRRGRRPSSGCFRQYHANHPRAARLVQRPSSPAAGSRSRAQRGVGCRQSGAAPCSADVDALMRLFWCVTCVHSLGLRIYEICCAKPVAAIEVTLT